MAPDRKTPPESGTVPAPTARASRPLRRLAAWLATIAAVILVPKCVVCAAGYLGIAAGLGISGAELCGAQAGTAPFVTFAIGTLLFAGAFIGGAKLATHLRRHATIREEKLPPILSEGRRHVR